MAAAMTNVALVDRGRVVTGESSTNGSFWTDNVSCAVGDTTATIINSKISVDSAIDPYAQTVSGNTVNVTGVVTTTGQAVITFKALQEAANIKLNVIDTSLDNQAHWTAGVDAAIGDTTVTITDSNITTSSTIKLYAKSTSGKAISYSNIAVTSGQIVATFNALDEAVNFKARIFNL